MTEIRTKRLLLRRARPDDLGAMHAILSDAEAMRYWSTLPHAELGQTRIWLNSMTAAPVAESDDFVIERNGEVIGKAGCWKLPEIGYILHPDVWGQGIAYEACRAVIDHVFATRADIYHLIADVDPNNAKSINLLTRLGFRKSGQSERTIQVGGVWCDSLYFRLDRD